MNNLYRPQSTKTVFDFKKEVTQEDVAKNRKLVNKVISHTFNTHGYFESIYLEDLTEALQNGCGRLKDMYDENNVDPKCIFSPRFEINIVEDSDGSPQEFQLLLSCNISRYETPDETANRLAQERYQEYIRPIETDNKRKRLEADLRRQEDELKRITQYRDSLQRQLKEL